MRDWNTAKTIIACILVAVLIYMSVCITQNMGSIRALETRLDTGLAAMSDTIVGIGEKIGELEGADSEIEGEIEVLRGEIAD